MKRMTGVVAAAAAATFILAGCSNDTSGNASGESPTTNQQTTNEQTGTEQTTDTNAGDGADASGDTTTGGEDSAGAGSDTTAGGEDTAGSDATGAMGSAAPTTTVGAGAEADEATVGWFTTYCEGIKPGLDEVKNIGSAASGGSTDPKAMMTKMGGTFENMGKAFTDTATALKDKPAPTFSGGENFATTAIDALTQVGGKMTETADAMKSGDVAKLSEMQTTMSEMSKVFSGMSADPAATKVIQSIPACKNLTSSMGG